MSREEAVTSNALWLMWLLTVTDLLPVRRRQGHGPELHVHGGAIHARHPGRPDRGAFTPAQTALIPQCGSCSAQQHCLGEHLQRCLQLNHFGLHLCMLARTTELRGMACTAVAAVIVHVSGSRRGLGQTFVFMSQTELGPGDGTVNKRSLEACAQLGPKVHAAAND